MKILCFVTGVFLGQLISSWFFNEVDIKASLDVTLHMSFGVFLWWYIFNRKENKL